MSQKKLHFINAFWIKNEAHYLRFREMADDKETFSAPYAQWAARAQQRMEEAAKHGLVSFKVNADPDEFSAWCKINSHRQNSRARAIFASVKKSSNFGRG